jgi:hypothetical protein
MKRTVAFLATVFVGGVFVAAAMSKPPKHPRAAMKPGTKNCGNCHPPFDPGPPGR